MLLITLAVFLFPKSSKVIFVSTEDDLNSTKIANKMQLSKLINNDKDLKKLENLDFIFDTDDLTKTLESILAKKKVDLIAIDAFADIFNKEINSSTQVRVFLMKFHSLAIKNNCLIIFLHHNNKRTEKIQPTKNNIVGSQGFEAKMRSIIEIRKSKGNVRHMVLLKCNFLPQRYKEIKYVLEFDEKTLLFSNTKSKIPINSDAKSNNPDLIKIIMKHSKNGLVIREIEAKLKGTKYEIGRTAIGEIIKINNMLTF